MSKKQTPESPDRQVWQAVGDSREIGEGQCLEFRMDSTAGFVVRADGRLRAFINRCPHLGIELNWVPGRFLDSGGSFIQCATHGALFTLDSGECIAGPCAGDALTPLEAREINDRIEVRFSPG